MLNINNAKLYVNNIINTYKNIEHTKKEYIGFRIVDSNIEILQDEGLKAKNNLRNISEIYSKLSISDIKVFIYSYIVIPLVCSGYLSELYLAEFNKNIAISNNLEDIKNYITRIMKTQF